VDNDHRRLTDTELDARLDHADQVMQAGLSALLDTTTGLAQVKARAGAIPAPADDTAHAAPHQPAPGTRGQACGLFAVDIVGFTSPARDDDLQLYLRDALYRILERAFNESSLSWTVCKHEDRGDGALVVVPPTTPIQGLIDSLPERLRTLIRVHNRLSSPAAQIQLRLAVHVGYVHRDSHGFAGDAVDELLGLLHAPRLKQLLADRGRELGLITSDFVHQTILRHQPTLMGPAAYHPVTVEVKQGKTRSWMHIPGLATFPDASPGEPAAETTGGAQHQAFIDRLRQLRRDCGRPSYAELRRLSQQPNRSGRRLRVLTESTTQEILAGKRAKLPDWAWVAAFVESCRAAAAERALDPAQLGTVEDWHRIWSAAHDDAQPSSAHSASTPRTRTGRQPPAASRSHECAAAH